MRGCLFKAGEVIMVAGTHRIGWKDVTMDTGWARYTIYIVYSDIHMGDFRFLGSV